MSLAHQIRPTVPAVAGNSARLPASYEAAVNALANCEALDECKDWADKAAALASYARQAEDVELERKAARIRARAMRRAGELLKMFSAQKGTRLDLEPRVPGHPRSMMEAGMDAKMSRGQVKQAVRVANVPAPDFEKSVESANPPTITALAQQGKQKRAAPDPDPDSWLKGRDPAAFNKAMHFVGLVEEYARDVAKADLETILPNLDERQRAKVRSAIAVIDPVHDTIATRV